MPWFPPHVPVAARRARVARVSDELRRNGVDVQPVHVEGRTIARSFWGRRWCHHLESCSDFENRLPRGRVYVRNGSVCHLSLLRKACSAEFLPEAAGRAKVSGRDAAFAG